MHGLLDMIKILLAALLLAIAAPAAAKNAKVYIFVAPEGRVEGAVPSALLDSATDLRESIDGSRRGGLAFTKHRAKARIVVQITSREEVAGGELRVHAHVTFDGRDADLIGTSTHQWKFAAAQIGMQLFAWRKAHPDPK
jgi:hypothetical protein